jgi:type IV secretory pathway TraG/TraD family ATPase VirD4
MVKRATGSSQQPWVSTSPIDGSFYFSASQVATADPTGEVLPPAPRPVPTPAPAPMPSFPAATPSTQSGFIFSDSDRRLLTPDDLNRLSKDDLRVARNEILARKGRYFNSPDLKTRFGQFSWYAPNTWDPKLNGVELANVATIERAESGSAQTTGSDFIIPDSDRRVLSVSDLRRLSRDELRIARNEIFARRGRYFEAADLKARFERFAWYHPNTWNPRLNSVEQANVALMDQVEKR